MNINRIPFMHMYAVLCVSYLLMISSEAYPFDFLHKATPIMGLLLWANLCLKHLSRILLSGALVFSAAGDIFLALPLNQSFMLGLGAFFIAHVFYILCLINRNGIKSKLDGKVLMLIIYFISVSVLVLPNTGDMWFLVLLYMLVLMAMAYCAFAQSEENTFLSFGAIFFVASDSLIAINKFVVPLPAHEYAIMTSYYLAQCLLVVGFWKGEKSKLS